MAFTSFQNATIEMLAHIAATCHDCPASGFVGDDLLLQKEIKKHGIELKDKPQMADIAIFHAPLDEAQLAELSNVGIVIAPLPSLLEHLELAKKQLLMLHKSFNIIMPFCVWLDALAPDSMDLAINHCWFVFASNKFHPLASFNLQRADMLDDLHYYSASMHQAAFVLPPKLVSALKNISKN